MWYNKTRNHKQLHNRSKIANENLKMGDCVFSVLRESDVVLANLEYCSNKEFVRVTVTKCVRFF